MSRLALLLTAALLAVLVFCGHAAASALSGDTQPLQEQLELHKAQAAASAPPRAPAAPDARRQQPKGAASASGFRLFAGEDDTAVDAIRMNVATNAVLQAFDGELIWGAAWDGLNQRVLFSSGASLHQWVPGSAPTALGTTVDSEATNAVFVALAWHDGVLYGSRSASGEAIYRIDPVTLVATPVIVYDTANDIGGLAIDPDTGVMYGTNDATGGAGRGLVSIAPDGTVTLVTPYPEGYTDIDGLAIGEGRAYLVTDDAADLWPVFDLDTMSYVEPLLSPFPSSEVFSGATWIRDAFRFAASEVHGWEADGAFYTRAQDPRVLPALATHDDALFEAGERIGDVVYMLGTVGDARELDAATGTILRPIATGPPSTGGTWSGMAHDPTTGTIYVSSVDGDLSTLHTWDAATGAATLVGNITNAGQVTAIAVDGSGDLWGIDADSETLVAINPATAFGTQVGALGFDADLGAGLAWNTADSTLYASLYSFAFTHGELRRVDRATGATVPVAILGADAPGSPRALFWLGFGSPLIAIFKDGFETIE